MIKSTIWIPRVKAIRITSSKHCKLPRSHLPLNRRQFYGRFSYHILRKNCRSKLNKFYEISTLYHCTMNNVLSSEHLNYVTKGKRDQLNSFQKNCLTAIQRCHSVILQKYRINVRTRIFNAIKNNSNNCYKEKRKV